MLLKTVNLRKHITFIKPNNISVNVNEVMEEIKQFIFSSDCKRNIILDLTELNPLHSIKIGVLSATYHFTKFINGKTYIIIQDKQVQKYIEMLDLSNTIVIYNTNQFILDNIA
jgi:anti-anti-sigma factor